MRALAVVLACVVGMAQWKADRPVVQCDGSATDVAFVLLERQRVTPFSISCPTCCDELCEDQTCGGTCYEYFRGPWEEVDRVSQPSDGPEVCFDWDSSPAGTPGMYFPLIDEIWIFRTATIDVAGNVGRSNCP